VKGSWTTEGTVRFEYDAYGVYFQNHYCLQWMVVVLASDSGSL
jgi:hypothetical protein